MEVDSRRPRTDGGRVDKFWSWLGLNLGKHWITVLLVGAHRDRRPRLRHDEARSSPPTRATISTRATRSTRTTSPIRTSSAARRWSPSSRWTPATPSPSCSPPTDIKQWTEVAANNINASGQVLNVVTPLTALQWNDNLVSRGPSGDVTKSVAGQDPRRPTSPATRRRRVRPRAARPRSRPSRASTRCRSRNARSTTRSTSTSCSTTIRSRSNPKPIRTPLLPFFPDARHAQMVVRLLGNESIKTGRQDRRPRDRRGAEVLHFAHAEITTTGAPALLENLNNYLTGGMATLGADRHRDHDADPDPALQRPVAAAAARDRADRHHLGLRHRGLPRNSAHDRDHLRLPRDARHRYRLRDPDARARRGRSGHRAGRRIRSRRRPATSDRRSSW